MASPRILLTNDDGIDAPGIASLYEELRAVGDVTVVAPDDDQSGVGRTRNGSVTVTEHPWGYRVAGTPADCVAFGLGGGVDGALDGSGHGSASADHGFDLVVAGVNHGPNVGNYVVGRSGTVGATVEAAFAGVPAVAVSGYHSREFHCYPPAEYEFSRPARTARRLLEAVDRATVFDDVDLLNVNAPVDVADPDLRLTRVVADYSQQVEPASEGTAADGGTEAGDADASGAAVDAAEDGRDVKLVDRTWPHVTGYENPLPDALAYRDRYPEASDRRALIDGAVSVSPLSMTHEHVESPELADAVDAVAVE